VGLFESHDWKKVCRAREGKFDCRIRGGAPQIKGDEPRGCLLRGRGSCVTRHLSRALKKITPKDPNRNGGRPGGSREVNLVNVGGENKNPTKKGDSAACTRRYKFATSKE